MFGHWRRTQHAAVAVIVATSCALLTACAPTDPAAPPTPLTAAAKAEFLRACAGSASQPATVVALVWNGRLVSGAVPLSLTGSQGVGLARTAKQGCYRITQQDRCAFGDPCDVGEVAVARHPRDEDDDGNAGYWGRPTDDTWLPQTVRLPSLPEHGVNGVVVALVPAGTARGTVTGLSSGRTATVYAIDAAGRLARAQTVTATASGRDATYTLGGLIPGTFTVVCTAGDAFPYDLPGTDTPSASVRVDVRAATRPSRPIASVPDCRPTGRGSAALQDALAQWDRNAALAG